DFIHVLEYLWKAAYCFCEESSQETEDWVLKRALKVLDGKASQVAAGVYIILKRDHISFEKYTTFYKFL
ncbi:MAG: hypothetical protein K8R53_06260, partial [Bacteroidales bacterium]|nr:hypothetical protein [Bacteroidales bacterium]